MEKERKNNEGSLLHTVHKDELQIDHRLKYKSSIKLLAENSGVNHKDVGLGSVFLAMTSKTRDKEKNRIYQN